METQNLIFLFPSNFDKSDLGTKSTKQKQNKNIKNEKISE